MPAKKSKPTDNPWADLDALMKADPEPTGPEWFYAAQFAERYNLSQAGASKRLNYWVMKGEVMKWKGYVRGSGCMAPKCKYRLK